MTQYALLLRGIGPVTHARMPLGALAGRLTEEGPSGVRSLGNTGNFVLESPLTPAELRQLGRDAVASFGLELEVFVRTRRQVQMLVTALPFADAAAARPDAVTVCFFHTTPRWPATYLHFAGPERLAMFSNHLFVDYDGRVSGSTLPIEKVVGKPMTQRNWNTVIRLAQALGAA